MPIDLWQGEFSPCSASDQTSFAYESTVKRWPNIITSIIDQLAHLNGTTPADQESKLSESKGIIRDLGGLIYEMRHDRVLTEIEDVGLPNDAKLYNSELSRDTANGHGSWFSSSWLYAECYMYRRIRTLFAVSTHWTTFDPFLTPKLSAFRSSSNSIMSLASAVSTLIERGPQSNDADLHVDFKAMFDTCLWGNATDLSLLTSLTHEQLQALQSTERGADFVLKNDLELVWEHLKSSHGKGRIDIVLDNSGFELYTDLVLADWFISLSPFCSEVVFHPKVIPWFVSDVLPHDFSALFTSLLDVDFFPADSGATEEEKAALKVMVERWQRYIKEGKFKLSVPWEMKMGEPAEMADFWSAPNAFCDLPELAPELLKELQKANLVIFKDKKLTGDACWPTTTPFEDTLGPLKGKITLLSLRTCKADVCVGLAEGKQQELDETDPSWRVSGKYAVVSFCPKDK